MKDITKQQATILLALGYQLEVTRGNVLNSIEAQCGLRIQRVSSATDERVSSATDERVSSATDER